MDLHAVAQFLNTCRLLEIPLCARDDVGSYHFFICNSLGTSSRGACDDGSPCSGIIFKYVPFAGDPSLRSG